MADKKDRFDEIRKAAQARENEEIRKAQEARREETKSSGRPQVVFTKIAGEDLRVLPEDAPVVQEAKAFRNLQLGIVENTPEEITKVGLPHPESHFKDESQAEAPSATELVYTKDTESLPKGIAGGMIADGVFEVVKGTEQAEPDAKSTPRNPKSVDAIDSSGTHPVRREDDTRTTLS
jgi:hypothetical protein